jgi:uncharacterized membrane protein
MKSNLFFLYFCVIFSIIGVSNIVYGATIHGTTYSYDLDKISNVLIEINSTPKQILYAVDGEYSLELPHGIYKIIALSKDGNEIQKAEEIINIYHEGKFNIDLFLMTLIEDDYVNNSIYLDIDELPNFPKKENNSLWIILISAGVLAISAVIAALLIQKKKNKKHIQEERVFSGKEEKYTKKDSDIKSMILNEISGMDGRATQKGLRKIIPFSESKISLVITELENEGKIKKIRKGRGNILIIKK